MKTTIFSQLSKDTREKLAFALNDAITELTSEEEGGFAGFINKNLEGSDAFYQMWAMGVIQMKRDMADELKK